jgi:biopolymer transport protein ExbD
MAEINVTPLVDVMLVLLIIFMISAPLMQSGVTLQLPKGNNDLQADENHLILSLDRDGKTYLQGKYTQPELILDKLKVETLTSQKTVFLEADAQIPYGKVAEMLSSLREAGILQVSLITEPTQTR